jgi:hypothetical protein
MNEKPNPLFSWATVALFCLAAWMVGYAVVDVGIFLDHTRPMMEAQSDSD